MKKLLIAIILMCIIVSGNTKTDFTLCDYFDGEYTAYTENKISPSSINLGSCYMSNFKIEDLSCLVGESMKIEDFEISSALKTLKAKVVKTEYIESGATIIYAYSPLIKRTVNFNGNKVNVQFAYYETYTIVGWPLILGSF